MADDLPQIAPASEPAAPAPEVALADVFPAASKASSGPLGDYGDSAPETDALLAGATNSQEMMRLVAQIPPAGTEPLTQTPTEEQTTTASGKKLPDRLRTRQLPAEVQDALAWALDNPDKSLRDFLGTAPAGAAAPTAPPVTGAAPEAATIPGLPAASNDFDLPELVPPAESPQSLAEQRDALRAQMEAAQDRFDKGTERRLAREIDAINARIPEADRAERAYVKGWQNAYLASDRQARATYPDAGNPASPLAREIARLDAQLAATGNPLHAHEDKPLLLAARAAARLGIAPRTGAAAATAAAPARPAPTTAQQRRAHIPGVTEPPTVAPGNARTYAPSAVTASQVLDEAMKNVHDSHDMTAVIRQFGL